MWPLYRFDPRRLVKGEPPLKLDYGPPKGEGRRLHAERVALPDGRSAPIRRCTSRFVAESQAAAERRYAVYQQLAGITVPVIQTTDEEPAQPDIEGE